MEVFEQFELEFASWLRLQSVVGCSSGTAALHLALETLGLPLGCEVLVPDYTMIACARAVTLAGMTPKFIDCDKNLLIDLNKLDQARTNRTRAIMAVHVYGRQIEMDRLHKFAKEYCYKVIEDLAEAHGVYPHPDTDASCWSFYKNKIVAGEEGGAVHFKLPEMDVLAKQLRSLGFTKHHDYIHIPRGHNYRLSNAHAKLILENLQIVRSNLLERHKIHELYEEYCPEEWKMPNNRVANWVYDIQISNVGRNDIPDVIEELQANGIEARYGFKRMTRQPEYFENNRGDSNAEKAARSVFYLPIVPGVTKEEKIKEGFQIIKSMIPE